MKITILTVGKIKEKYLKDAIAEYAKRLSRYCKLQIVEVEDEKTPDGASAAMEDQIKEKEAARLSKCLDEEAFLITLEIQGKMLDSESFSKTMEQICLRGKNHIQFVIGGSLGLHTSITECSDLALSFSKMTFPHQLMRVILLEQVYRSFRIQNNEPYHK
ncbi:MAG: 23S rRNA (pseudouridine(1915)-N(3))-methyltransferase RlmH [Clostridiales bacterium]|nr:23S rRNA (pseudouridine(1915)-N(3))-methyltransferase RlmH [Clostridiales bacterium]